MHAIRQHEFGDAATLRYETVDDPVPAEGQVRIAVAAAGVHVLDTTIRRHHRQGRPQAVVRRGRRAIPDVDLETERWL